MERNIFFLEYDSYSANKQIIIFMKPGGSLPCSHKVWGILYKVKKKDIRCLYLFESLHFINVRKGTKNPNVYVPLDVV
jgi:hypothetical protein